MAERGSRFIVEDLVLPFLSASTAERWILATESEEISLILGELSDLFCTLSAPSRLRLSKKQLANVVLMVLSNLESHDNSLVLNGLKFLRLIADDYADTIGNVLTQLVELVQSFLQDNSRIIRHSALRLIASIVVKLPFHLTSNDIVAMLESIYQFHEFGLKTASLGVLRFINECQSSLMLKSRITTQYEPLLSVARYGVALLQHSSIKGPKKVSQQSKQFNSGDDTDSSDDGPGTIDGLFNAYDSALDLVSICSFALATVDGCKGGGRYSFSHLRRVSSSALLQHLIEVADCGSLSKSAQLEICQRMRNVSFPSLSDEEITEISEEMMSELLQSHDDEDADEKGGNDYSIHSETSISNVKSDAKKVAYEDDRSLEHMEQLSLSRKYSSTAVKSDVDVDTDSSFVIQSRLSVIKSTHHNRPTLNRSHSLNENDIVAEPSLNVPKPSRTVISADPIHRMDPILDPLPPISVPTDELFNDESNSALSPSRDSTDDLRNKNYTRAASSRVKRSRLKQPPPSLQIDPPINALKWDIYSDSSNVDDQLLIPDIVLTPHQSISTLNTPLEGKSTSQFTPKTKSNHSSTRRKLKFDSEPSQQIDPPPPNNVLENSIESIDSLHHPSGLKPEGVEYTNTKDLQPVKNPTQEFARAMRGLETQEWPDIFETLNMMRRLVIHHPQIVNGAGGLHSILMLVMKQVDNLRSSLAKNALIAVGDFFLGLKRFMDAEVPTVLVGVLKRSADSSNFLGESADRALENMIDHASATKVLGALLLHAEHKTAGIRAKVSGCLLLLLQRRLEDMQGPRELDGLKSRLNKLLQDQNPEARSHAREITKYLLNNGGVVRSELEQFVSSDLIEKALKDKPSLTASFYSPLRGVASFSNATLGRQLDEEAVSFSAMRKSSPRLLKDEDFGDIKMYSLSSGDTRRAPNSSVENTPSRPSRRKIVAEKAEPEIPIYSRGQQAGEVEVASPIARTVKKGSSNNNNSSHITTAAKRVLDGDPELMQWQNVLITIANSKNWVEKKDAMTSMTNMLIKFYTVLRDVGKLETCLDGILDRLSDGSIKIVGHALDCLERILAEEPAVLQSGVLQIVAPKFLNAISSTNKQVSSRSMAIFRDVLSSTSAIQAAQYLSGIAEHDKDKMRIAALKTLIELVGNYCSDPDFLVAVVKKVIFTTTCRIVFADSSKVEIRLVCTELLKTIQTCVRQERIYKWVDSPHQQEEIKRITAGS